ncbi:hypothetical protein WDZ92_45440, partial [Nostoc sp. NIES-2111]
EGRSRESLDGLDEAVALFGESFDELGFAGGLAEGEADLADGVVQALVEFDVGAMGPEGELDFFPRHEAASGSEENFQDASWLWGELGGEAGVEEFSGRGVEFEVSEAQPVVFRGHK